MTRYGLQHIQYKENIVSKDETCDLCQTKENRLMDGNPHQRTERDETQWYTHHHEKIHATVMTFLYAPSYSKTW